MKKNKIYQTGFSIIELLIALTISTVLILGVGVVFHTSKSTYRSQEALSDVSDNARFALYFLEQDIATAGFWGCNSNAASNSANGAQAAGNGVSSIKEVNNGLINTPTTVNFAAGNGITGIDGPAAAAIPNAADTITIQGLFGQPIPATIRPSDDAITLDTPVTLAAETLLAMSNCQEVEIFQNSADVNNSTQIPHANGAGTIGPGNQSNRFSSDTLRDSGASEPHLYQANQVSYTVRTGPPPRSRPSLYRFVNTAVPPAAAGVPAIPPLLEGVTDVQFTYGEDTNGDGNADRFLPAGAVAAPIPQNMANVVAVNATLSFDSNRIGITQVAADAGGQRRLVRTLTKTFALRNRLPIITPPAPPVAPPPPGP